MKHYVDVKTLYNRAPREMVAEVKEAASESLLAMAKLWRDKLLKEHFEPGAKYVFHYKIRQRKYLKSKVRLALAGKVEDGGTTDLVFSGRTRRLALVSTTVQSTPQTATATTQVPFYIKFRKPKPNSPNMEEELLRISSRQNSLLHAAASKAFSSSLRIAGRATTTTTA